MEEIFAIADEDGCFVDKDCFYYDKSNKKFVCIHYHGFYNYILLGDSQTMTKMKVDIETICKKHNVHKIFEVKKILI